jgi:hypothetical protein
MCCACDERNTARAMSRVQAYAIANPDSHPRAHDRVAHSCSDLDANYHVAHSCSDLDAHSCSDLDVRSCGSIADSACVWAHTGRLALWVTGHVGQRKHADAPARATRMYDCTSRVRIGTSSGVRGCYPVFSARTGAGVALLLAQICAGTRRMCCVCDERNTARAMSRVQAYAIANPDSHPRAHDHDAHSCADLDAHYRDAHSCSDLDAHDRDVHPCSDLDAHFCSDLDVRSCGSIAETVRAYGHTLTCRVRKHALAPALVAWAFLRRKRLGMTA